MSVYAGFAVIAQFHQSALQDLIDIYYNAGVIPSQFTGNTSPPAGMGLPPVNIQYELYLESPPIIELRGTVPNTIDLWATISGGIQLTSPFGSSTQVIRLVLHLTASPLAQLTPTGFRLGIDTPTITVVGTTVEIIKGATPAALVNFIQSPNGHLFLTLLIRAAIGSSQLSFPLNLPTLGQLGPGSFTGIITHVMEECLSIAADVKGSYFDTDPNETFKTVSTQGDPNLIKSNLFKSDVAIYISSTIMPLLWIPLVGKLNEELQKKNVQIKYFKLMFEKGNFLVTGQGQEGPLGEHAADFSLRIRVLMGTPDSYVTYDEEYGEQITELIPGINALVLDAYDVNVDPLSSAPLGEILAFIGIMTIAYPAAPLLFWPITQLIDEVCTSIERQVALSIDQQAYGSLSERITLPETDGPYVYRQLTAFQISPQGFMIRSRLDPAWGEKKSKTLGLMIGPDLIDIDRSQEPLVYRFEWVEAAGWQESPYLSIRWQVHRGDTGAVIRVQDQFMNEPGSTEFTLNLLENEVVACKLFNVSCRVYSFKDLFNETITLPIRDVLDKSFPFVSWAHPATRPVVIKHPNGQLKHLGYRTEIRFSAIHRTDFPGRCSFAGIVGHKAQMTYYKQLPFEQALIENHRDELCDYCFYGGPHKTKLLPDALAIVNSTNPL